MILLLALAIGFTSALLRPGRLSALSSVQIRGLWAIVLVFLLQYWAIEGVSDTWVGWAGPVVVATQLLLAVILWVNRSLPGFQIVLLGSLLNVLVMAANGGYMAVSWEAVQRAGHEALIRQVGERTYLASSKDVVLDPGETRLYPLSDIFTVPKGAPVSGNFSIGDALIAIGLTWFFHQAGEAPTPLPAKQGPTAQARRDHG